MKLYCPNCEWVLEKRGKDQLFCVKCSNTTIVRDGVPDFAEKPYYYMRDKNAEKMHQILRDIELKSWCEIEDTLFADEPSLRNKIFNLGRSDWRFLLDINKNSTVLDLGCGYGTMTVPLSYMAKIVYAVDATFEQCQFTKIRIEKQKIKNAECLCADINTLPFPDKYFDVIIMIGVLEWLATGDDKKSNPKKIQQDALIKLYSKLKDDGQILIGIENRLSYKYFLGKRDEHVGVRLAPLLPRRIADWYVGFKKNIPYRNYTYTKFGYNVLLKNAGFNGIEYFMPLPFYHNPAHILPLSGHNRRSFNTYYENLDVKTNTRKLLRVFGKLLCLNKVLEYFAPSFLILAYKVKKQETSLWQHTVCSEKITEFYKIPTRIAKSSCVAFFLYTNKQNKPIYLKKTARFPENNVQIKKEIDVFNELKSCLSNEQLIKIPKAIEYSNTGPLHSIVYEAFHGKKLLTEILIKKRNVSPNYFIPSYEKIFDFLTNLHLQTKSGEMTIDRKAIDNIINNELTPFVKEFNLSFEEKCLYEKYLESFEIAIGTTLPLVVIHGDLSVYNILWQKENFKVIDWELSEKDVLPFYDLYNFIFSILALDNEFDKSFLVRTFKEHVYNQNSTLSVFFRRELKKYAAIMKINESAFRYFLPLFFAKKKVNDDNFVSDRSDIWKELFLLHIKTENKFFI